MQHPAYNEERLVERAATGDADAFGELYRVHLDAIYRYIFFRVGNPSDAEDLTEQVFLNAWEAFPRYQQRGYPFTTWLYRIAHNVIIDHHRQQKPLLATPLSAQSDRPSKETPALDQVIEAEEATALASAVAQLPREQQQVLMLRFVEGLNHTEVARILAKSQGACRIIQHRALTTLNHMLRSTFIVVCLVLLGVGGFVYRAAHALPGDRLYGAKRTMERAQLVLLLSPVHDSRLRLDFATRRLNEVAALLKQDRATHIAQPLDDYIAELQAVTAMISDVSVVQQAELSQELLAVEAEHAAQLSAMIEIAPVTAHPALNRALVAAEAVRAHVQQTPVTPIEPTTPTIVPPTRQSIFTPTRRPVLAPVPSMSPTTVPQPTPGSVVSPGGVPTLPLPAPSVQTPPYATTATTTLPATATPPSRNAPVVEESAPTPLVPTLEPPTVAPPATVDAATPTMLPTPVVPTVPPTPTFPSFPSMPNMPPTPTMHPLPGMPDMPPTPTMHPHPTFPPPPPHPTMPPTPTWPPTPVMPTMPPPPTMPSFPSPPPPPPRP